MTNRDHNRVVAICTVRDIEKLLRHVLLKFPTKSCNTQDHIKINVLHLKDPAKLCSKITNPGGSKSVFIEHFIIGKIKH